MTPSGFEDDATSVVDEELLAEIRAEAARRSRAGQTYEPTGPSGEVIALAPDREAEPVDASDLEDEPVVGGYGAFREIGRGGFSRVYEALQFDFERWVAVKVLNGALDGDETAEFERECRLMGVLSRHPNIVTVLDSAFTDGGLPCIVMELFSDGSFLDVIQASGPLGLEELLSMAVSISGALATAHRQGVVHGDVKPQNIFRSEFGAALGDFGIASLANHGYGPTKTRLSLYYAAPEVIERGAAALSPFSDQYSLAATLYTLATGERPFHTGDSGSTRELLLEALTAPVPHLGRDFPAPLADALYTAMTREPALRHRDMRAFAAAIGDVEAELGYRRTEMHVLTGTGRYSAQVPGPNQSPSRDLSSSRDQLGPPASATGPRRHTESREISDDHSATTIVRPSLPAPQPPPPPDATRRRRRWPLITAAVAVLAAAGVGALALSGVITLPGADGDSDAAPEVREPVTPEPVSEPVPAPEPPPEDPVLLPADAPPPEPPGAMSPDSIDVDPQREGLVVIWDGPPDSDAPILFYRLQWTGPDGATEEMLVDWADTTARILGLDSDTEYGLRLAAENEHGQGEWAEFGGRTLPEGVPSPPELGITPVEGGLVVAWSAPGDEEWPITRYYLEWEGPDGRITREQYSADVSGTEILDPVRGHTYVMRVAAENQNGRGGWARETFTIPITPPEPPRALTVQEHFRRLVVNWDEPADDGGSAVTGYRAELHSDGGVQQFRNAASDGFTADFRGLDSGRSYEVRLFAENEAGLSDAAQAHGFSLYRIAFASDFGGRDAIYFADVSRTGGSFSVAEPERLSGIDQAMREDLPSWSPDGLWIAFQRRHPDGTHWQIWAKSIESGEEIQLVCGRENGWSPDWSPDGLSIAFARGSRGNDLWMIDVKTGEETSLKDVFDADDAYPSWSPDGGTIAFARRDHNPRRSSWYNSRQPREIRVLSGVGSAADALPVVRLTNHAAGNYSAPDWSPEGDRIAYSVSEAGSDTRHIAVMDKDGNELMHLASDHADDHPSWSPDGEWIAFARGTDGARDLYVVSAAGGEPVPLLVNDAADFWAPSWAPSSDASVSPAFDCGA